MNVQTTIEHKLRDGLSPIKLDVRNVSHEHRGHAGSPGTGESHFNVTVVSDKFEGMGKVARHKLVYGLLKDEMAGPVHALALMTFTPQEFAAVSS